MHAVVCRRASGSALAQLEDIDCPFPRPVGHDLLVRIEAASLNPIDLKRRMARPDPDRHGAILGWSAVGTVERTGPATREFELGQRVWYVGAGNRPGCFATFQCVDERLVGHAPTKLSAAQAATMPLPALTAAEALFDHLRLSSVERPTALVINGGGGAVAAMAVQLARRHPLIEIIATAGSMASVERLRHLGVHHIVNHRHCLWQQVRQLTCSAPDKLLSMHTTEMTWEAYITMLAPFGHLCIADHPPAIDIMAARSKSLTLHWQAVFTRTINPSEDMAYHGRHLTEIGRLCDAGELSALPARQALPMCAANIAKAMDHVGVDTHRSVFIAGARNSV